MVVTTIFREVYSWILRLFWAFEIDITLVGLHDAGKTSILRVLTGGGFSEDSVPTIGFNMKRVQKGYVTVKCWDLGGQRRFRSMWERYCQGVNAIIFVVDSSNPSILPTAQEELHKLMNKPVVEGIPLLVLANKSDLQQKLSVDEVIEGLNMKAITHRDVGCYAVSAKTGSNMDVVLQWMISRAK